MTAPAYPTGLFPSYFTKVYDSAVYFSFGEHELMMTRIPQARLVPVFVIVCLGLSISVGAQKNSPEKKGAEPTTQITAKPETPEPAANEDPNFKGMKYRLVGPYRGGRSLTAAGIPGDP